MTIRQIDKAARLTLMGVAAIAGTLAVLVICGEPQEGVTLAHEFTVKGLAMLAAWGAFRSIGWLNGHAIIKD